MARKYHICAHCDAELNPNLWDDCEKYYVVGGEIYCKDCFKEWIVAWVEENLDEAAAFVDVPVVYVEG